MTAEKSNKKSFLSGLKTEWEKITWLSKEKVSKQTGIVIIVSTILCFLITLLDSGALSLIEQLTK